MLEAQLRLEIQERMKELRPLIEEVKHLEEIMVILDAWQAERNHKKRQPPSKLPMPTRRLVERFITTVDLGDTFRPRDMQRELDLSPSVANNWVGTMVQEGKLEKFGKGQYRRPINKAGTARLKVVTK